MSNCCLCSNLVSENPEPWNTPLLESNNFVVLPSLGSLVEGWLLIVPKEHYVCAGAFPAALAQEMSQLKQRVERILEPQFGAVCAFEHGPAAGGRPAGCGVDHAHLHVVPLSFDLAAAATEFLPRRALWQEGTWDTCRRAFEGGLDYLYIEQPLDVGRIATHNGFDSQILRRAIAAQVGMIEQFNWRQHHHLQTISKTIQAVNGSINAAR